MLEYDALFAAERVRAPGLGALLESALGPGGTRPGLAVGAAPVLRNVALGECREGAGAALSPCASLWAQGWLGPSPRFSGVEGAQPSCCLSAERPLDPCAELFACRAGFACVAGADGNATCTSLCHRDYCKNHGICTHPRDRGPLCQ